MKAERNLTLIKIFTVVTNMLFVIPVIVPYYRDEMGLTFQDFLIGEAAFSAVVLLLEVPTGWLSDVWQRKYVLALGMFFDILGFSLMMMADNLFMAAAAQMLIGVGICLLSGTHSALLYDTLLSLGREKEFRKREGQRQGLALYTCAFSSVVGGLIYPYAHHLPNILTIIFSMVGIVAAILMIEPSRHKKTVEKHPLADMMATMKYALHGHADVALIILFSAVLYSSTKLIMWAQQPYYMETGIPESAFGALMAVGSERCATILSTQNLITQMFFIPVSFVIGKVTTDNGVSLGLIAIAGWLGTAGVFLVLWATRKKWRRG